MCLQNNQDLVGRRVQINVNILNRKSKKYFNLYRTKGIIRSIYKSNVAVEIYNVKNKDSTFGYFYLKLEELDIQTDDNEKESNMNANDNNNYKGKFRIALIQFLDGTKQEVYYRIYDDGFEYKEEDLVVVKPAHHSLTIARIKYLYVADYTINHNENREVVCPIDLSKYQERNKRADEIVNLKKEIDKKVKELQGVALYRLMAQNSPELKSMLDKYEQLLGHEMSVNEVINET